MGIVVGLALLDSKWGGRRIQLALVTATICPLLVLVGLSSQFGWSTHLELALLCLFAFSWQLAWGMIPWVYPSELFTMAERDRATSLAVFVQYAANAALMVVVPQLLDALGFAGMVCVRCRSRECSGSARCPALSSKGGSRSCGVLHLLRVA